MRISVLTIGAIASILSINSVFANTVVTSQTYVDNQDALKVNIAQGTGTNNANVGKTLVVNSQGNLELGAPAAGNYVEDSITDGVTNKAPSENAVHDALANKQNTIPATGTNSSTPGSTVVTYTSTAGTIGERGILEPNAVYDSSTDANKLVTAGNVVPAIDFLYGGDPNTVVVRNLLGAPLDARGIYDGSTTYNSSTDADKLVTASALQNVSYEINNMPTKTVTDRTCTRWIDGQSHTDANCLLWNLVDETVYGYCSRNTNDCDWLTPSCDSGLVGCCLDNRCQCSPCTK